MAVTTVEAKIEKALLDRVASLTLVPALPVAWPNVDFPGKDSNGVPNAMPASYIIVQHFPNKNTRLTFGSTDPSWRRGFLQLTAVTPLNKGSLAAKEIAGKIAEHFPADLPLDYSGVRVRVVMAPDIAPEIETDVSWSVPVSVYYEAFV